MKHIYILSTCDNWKSRGSMIRYYVGSSDKAGTRRMLAAIKKGIREHIYQGVCRYQGATIFGRFLVISLAKEEKVI